MGPKVGRTVLSAATDTVTYPLQVFGVRATDTTVVVTVTVTQVLHPYNIR